jgi:hypothetical protein
MAGWKEIEPNVWKPANPGDSIEGVLVNKVPREQDMSAKYYIEVTEPSGKTGIKMLWGSTVLDDRMQFVDPGQKVRITFKEKKKNKKNQDLNIYKVEVAQK